MAVVEDSGLVVVLVPEPAADAFDVFHFPVGAFGDRVRDVGVFEAGDDLVMPSLEGPADGFDLGDVRVGDELQQCSPLADGRVRSHGPGGFFHQVGVGDLALGVFGGVEHRE